MKTRGRFVLAIVAVLFSGLAAYAKGSPNLIVISGGGLTGPIEISDAASLKAFDPWFGQFADWKRDVVSEPACSRQSCQVVFYMKWPGRKSALDRGDLKAIYVVRYCFADGAGFVYLPARDEAPRVNMATILRDGRDGTWNRATPEWDALMRKALATSAKN